MIAARQHGVVTTTARGVLLTVGVTLLVIAGLLGMHALSVGHTVPVAGHGSMAPPAAHPTAHSAAAHSEAPAGASAEAASAEQLGVSSSAAVTSAGACVSDDCGGASHGHALQLMMCALALLAVALVLLAPRLLRGLLPHVPSTLTQLRVLLRTLPHPRPPSLHVLSISRT